MRCDTQTPAERTGQLFGIFAFASVVLASFAQLTFSRRLHDEPWQLVGTFVGGAVYFVLAVASPRWTDTGRRRATAVYFVGQCLLVSTLILISPIGGFFGIIALPLAAQSFFDLRWPRAVLLTLALFATCVLRVGMEWGQTGMLQAMVQFSPAFIFTAVFSFLTARSFEARRQAEALSTELAAANARLHEQSAQAEELATTRERNRVAREIHDGLGHYLTVINVQIDAARALLDRDPPRAAESLAKASRLSREALEEVRASVSNLHQSAPTPPLMSRLQALCADGGNHTNCHLEGSPRPLSIAVEHALYRAAQEGLTNVRKHAGAATAELTMDYRDAHRVTLRISDTGALDGPARPVPPAGGTAGGFGLRGLRERVELLGGRILSGPRPEGGFELRIEIPA